ncbi:triose-phosphate isomerase [Patescibacteria group bacterium]|nr:triose-phosphate isomerase [Patescibacteria group bacterium]
MSKTYIIANWKMNLMPKEAILQAKNIAKEYKSLKGKKDLELVICPSFTEIAAIAKILQPTGVFLGSQDVFWEEKGSYTSSISANTLKEYGCKYVIIGHSERRKLLNESNESINLKIKAALKAGLIPILCIGETFTERQAGQKESVLFDQVLNGLKDIWLKKGDSLLIAYEPVWVIGSGQAVDPDEAEITQAAIKRSLLEFMPAGVVADNIFVLYGGSVNGMNVKSFLSKPSIDGVLVGGASIDIEKFKPIINYK